MVWLTSLILILLVFWIFERFYLRGVRHDEYPIPADRGVVSRFTNLPATGPEQEAVTKTVNELAAKITHAVRHHQMQQARALIDTMSDGRHYASKFIPVDAGGVPAEWVVAPAADPARRMLYIHGGAFIMGSPKSHRTITSKFSEITGCAVLAIDYRLLPGCRGTNTWIVLKTVDLPINGCLKMGRMARQRYNIYF